MPGGPMVLRSARLSLRSWTFHDDELADEWPPHHDPIKPLWNLPRQASLSSEHCAFVEGASLQRTWGVEVRSHLLIVLVSLRDIDSSRSQARLGITFTAP